MKILIKLLSLVFAVSIFFVACETDFDIASDWKEITVVYGILNPNENQHFVRIQKAFLDEETSALAIAEINDSLFHSQNLNVKLVKVNNNQEIAMSLVNGEEFGIYKEEGVFANSPNLLYRAVANLDAESDYKIVITNSANQVITAQTGLIEDFRVNNPPPIEIVPDIRLIGSDLNIYEVNWRNDENAFIYDLTFRFFYTEFFNDEATNLQFDWDIVKNKNYGVIGENIIKQGLQKEEFLNAVVENVGPVNEFITRQIDSLQFHITVGAEDLNTYSETLVAQQTSIAAGQSQTPFTNIEGTNAIGLFSSRFNKVVYGLDIDGVSKDSLVCNPLTKDLNFLRGSLNSNPCN